MSYFLADSFLVETTSNPDSLSLAGLEQAFLLVRERLRSFAGDPAFSAKLALAFGGSLDGQVAQSLVQAWEKEGFGAIPTLEVIGGSQLNGAIGAFAVSTNRIYLSEEFLVQNRGNLEAIAAVLLEEYGHYLDVLLNGGLDSAGDEGAIFAAIVLGKGLSDAELGQLKVKDDHGVININGNAIVIEMDQPATVPLDQGGNTFETAYDLGTITGNPTIIDDFVGIINPIDSDFRDYYKLQISGNSTVNLKLSGLSADANLTLLNSDRSVNIASQQSGSVDENIIRNLTAGTYFVLVESASEASSTNYRLEAKAILLGPDQGGNTLATATDIGAITSTPNIINDFIGNFNGLLTDDYDYYKFQITEDNSAINLKLSGLNNSASIFRIGSILRGSTSFLKTEAIFRRKT